jgi:hypothetical protein
MQLDEKNIKRIFNKYKKSFQEMEHYDRTREILWKRKRLDITLNQRVINKLKELSIKKNKPISHIIEDAVLKV